MEYEANIERSFVAVVVTVGNRWKHLSEAIVDNARKIHMANGGSAT